MAGPARNFEEVENRLRALENGTVQRVVPLVGSSQDEAAARFGVGAIWYRDDIDELRVVKADGTVRSFT